MLIWGLMTKERWRWLAEHGTHLRVLLAGNDVTEQCREADDEQGWVVLHIPVPGSRPQRWLRNGRFEGPVRFRIR